MGVQHLEIYKLKILKPVFKINIGLFIDMHTDKFHLKL